MIAESCSYRLYVVDTAAMRMQDIKFTITVMLHAVNPPPKPHHNHYNQQLQPNKSVGHEVFMYIRRLSGVSKYFHVYQIISWCVREMSGVSEGYQVCQ